MSPAPDSARDAAIVPLECLVPSLVWFCLTGILCALALPLIAISMASAGVWSAVYALCYPVQKRPHLYSEIRKRWHSNEFAFERAIIDAYEELIDAHARKRL